MRNDSPCPAGLSHSLLAFVYKAFGNTYGMKENSCLAVHMVGLGFWAGMVMPGIRIRSVNGSSLSLDTHDH